ncbi:hypothetical protein AOLI_G00308730 [Acnodon oligacanthus]
MRSHANAQLTLRPALACVFTEKRLLKLGRVEPRSRSARRGGADAVFRSVARCYLEHGSSGAGKQRKLEVNLRLKRVTAKTTCCARTTWVYRERSEKEEISSEGSCVDENALLM